MFYEELVLHFTIYSMIGYICEVIYCSIGQRRFVNRGFLYGPFLPIYGFGGLIVYVLPAAIKGNLLLLFASGFVLTSILEYFSSWLMEKCFSIKLWDYSERFANINGRVCLLNSTLFGIMSVASVNIVEPKVSRLISAIPNHGLHPLVSVIVAGFAADVALSVMKMLDFRRGLEVIRTRRKEIEEKTKALVAAGKKDLAEELRKRMDEDLHRYREAFLKRTGHIVRANPSMSAKSDEIRRQLEIIAEWNKERREMKRRHKAEIRSLDENAMRELRRK